MVSNRTTVSSKNLVVTRQQKIILMKITQILNLLIYFICFSCDRTQTVVSNENKWKEDSLRRVQFLSHSDSVKKMYFSIKIPHIWNEVEIIKGKTTILKSSDTLYPHKQIYIDITTEPRLDLLQFIEGE